MSRGSTVSGLMSRMLDRAIDAYRAAPLTADAWFRASRAAWVRAFGLAIRRGPEGQIRVQEMSEALKAQVLAGQVSDNFRTVGFAQTLRRKPARCGWARRDVRGAIRSCGAGFVGKLPPVSSLGA